jgi:hypothetical protein
MNSPAFLIDKVSLKQFSTVDPRRELEKS